MNEEIHQAFAHPRERSVATQSDTLLDRISLRDHIVSVEIGAFQAERDMTQRISFNIVVEVRHTTDDLGDDVDRILSYDRVTEAIDIELAAERLNLLETLAERVAHRILLEPQAQRVFVRIEKLDRGGGALGVEIVRGLKDAARDVEPNTTPLNARVVFLSQAAIISGYLSNWIDQLSAMGAPLVLVVPAITQGPRVNSLKAQAQIDLLAMEQSAWALCATEPRCAVVETRTELDWATKNGQICVWAPAKFVMDSVDQPIDLVCDPVALADWFACEIGAIELLLIGEDLPTSSQSACRALSAERIDL